MKKMDISAIIVSVLLTGACVVPFLYIFLLCVRDTEGTVTFLNFYKVFLAESQYLLRFWKSLLPALAIAGGQVLVSVLAGFGFAKCRFPGKDVLFFALLILMILPLQVTLVANYLILDAMHWLDTYYALVLPNIFVPLGTFIMTQSFKAVPNEIIEAARLDGCTTLGIIVKIAVPMNLSGLLCTMLLSFLDGWNMVEQPLVYLQDVTDYPLSVALALTRTGTTGVQMVCCLLTALPSLFLFSYFNSELVEGITIGGEK